MTIASVLKKEWYRAEESLEKWYNAELELRASAKNNNPLFKLFTKHTGYDVLSLNTQRFYSVTDLQWDKDRNSALKRNPSILKRLVKKTDSYIRDVNKTLQIVEKQKTIDTKTLKKIKTTFLKIWWIFLSDLGKPLAPFIENMLTQKGLGPKQQDAVIDYCFNFKHPLGYQKEERELRKIYKQLPKSLKKETTRFENLPEKIKKLLVKHCEIYQYLTGAWLDTEPETPSELLQRLLKAGKTSSPRRLRKIPQKIKEHLNKEDFRLLKLIRQHIFFDNYVSDIYERLEFLFNQYLSKQFLITPKNLSWYSFDELEALTKYGKKLTNQELKKRKKYRIMTQIDGEISMFYGKINFEEAQKAISGKASLLVPATIIKGFPASRGFIRASVAIVNETKDIRKVKAGNILVSVMTHPDLMLAIQKCSGIITDAGGITSHAAIISREFNIPCIVGTGIATKILKDGDLVELDANNGIVRIMS